MTRMYSIPGAHQIALRYAREFLIPSRLEFRIFQHVICVECKHALKVMAS